MCRVAVPLLFSSIGVHLCVSSSSMQILSCACVFEHVCRYCHICGRFSFRIVFFVDRSCYLLAALLVCLLGIVLAFAICSPLFSSLSLFVLLCFPFWLELSRGLFSPSFRMLCPISVSACSSDLSLSSPLLSSRLSAFLPSHSLPSRIVPSSLRSALDLVWFCLTCFEYCPSHDDLRM